MLKYVHLAFVAISLCVTACRDDSTPHSGGAPVQDCVPPHFGMGVPPAFCVYVSRPLPAPTPHMPTSYPVELPILAIYDDGTVRWSSEMPVQQSVQEGHVPRQRVQQFLDDARRVMATRPVVRRNYSSPDALHTVIALRGEVGYVCLRSLHEQVEASPDLVATEQGIEETAGRDRSAVQAAGSQQYVAFRQAWGELRTLGQALVREASDGTQEE